MYKPTHELAQLGYIVYILRERKFSELTQEDHYDFIAKARCTKCGQQIERKAYYIRDLYKDIYEYIGEHLHDNNRTTV